MYEDLRVRSKLFLGIDRDVFVRFSPIPVSTSILFILFDITYFLMQGLWGHRVYNTILNYSETA